MDGFINFNKPGGWTSHDCVAKVRRLLRIRKVGHAGTLDPAATGVLPIAVGRATRLIQFLPSHKTYQGTVRFGLRTTTDDLEGEVLWRQDASALTLEVIQLALPTFEGLIQQIPPSYSAIQVDGKRLYDLARAGQAVEAPVRTVQVDRLQVLDWRPGPEAELELAIACGAGTYIRSIARDLGDQVGTGATLASLIRTESSSFHLADSLTLEELEQQLQDGTFKSTSPAIALRHLPVIRLEEPEALRWRMGQKLPLGEGESVDSRDVVQVWQGGDRLLGVGQRVVQEHGLILRPTVVLVPADG